VRKTSVLLRLAAAGAVVLGAAAAAVPANAASTAPQTSAAGAAAGSAVRALSVSPDSAGSTVCEGDLCIQRITSIINNSATVEAWADGYTFTGHFELLGPDGHMANCPASADYTWVAGGTGCNFKIPAGTGYTIKAWEGTRSTGYHVIGQVDFRV